MIKAGFGLSGKHHAQFGPPSPYGQGGFEERPNVILSNWPLGDADADALRRRDEGMVFGSVQMRLTALMGMQCVKEVYTLIPGKFDLLGVRMDNM